MNVKPSLLYCDAVIHVSFAILKSLLVTWFNLLTTAHVYSQLLKICCVFVCLSVLQCRICGCVCVGLCLCSLEDVCGWKLALHFPLQKKSTNIFPAARQREWSWQRDWAGDASERACVCVCGDLGTVVICVFISVCVGRLGYVDHAEELASRFLQCFPKNRLSAQAALHHEYFSHLPPRLWELPDSQSTHITSHHCLTEFTITHYYSSHTNLAVCMNGTVTYYISQNVQYIIRAHCTQYYMLFFIYI